MLVVQGTQVDRHRLPSFLATKLENKDTPPSDAGLGLAADSFPKVVILTIGDRADTRQVEGKAAVRGRYPFQHLLELPYKSREQVGRCTDRFLFRNQREW